jgi:hypothetical protein
VWQLHHGSCNTILNVRGTSPLLQALIDGSKALYMKLYSTRHPTFRFQLLDDLSLTMKNTLTSRAISLGGCSEVQPGQTPHVYFGASPDKKALQQLIVGHSYNQLKAELMEPEIALQWMDACEEEEQGPISISISSLHFEPSASVCCDAHRHHGS